MKRDTERAQMVGEQEYVAERVAEVIEAQSRGGEFDHDGQAKQAYINHLLQQYEQIVANQ